MEAEAETVIQNPDLAAAAQRVYRAIAQAESTGPQKVAEVYDFEKVQAVKKWQEKLEDAGIFARYKQSNFASFEHRGVPAIIRQNYERVKQYAQTLEDHIKNGEGLILRGQIGTMKTSLAVAVLQHTLAQDLSGFFVTMPSLLDTIFTLKERNPEEWVRFEHKLRTTRLLVVDDLGAEYKTDWVLNKVDAIISERYNRCLPMIVTTNLTGEQMRTTYADRVIDRLRSTCEIVTFQGQSMRLTIEP